MSRFNSIIGHEALKPQLSNLLSNPGVHLFFGPPSIGKKTVAFEASKYLLCLDRKEDECSCSSCRAFKSGHPDFLFIGKLSVDVVDYLLDFSFRAPLLSNTKTIILDNIETGSVDSINRLLKLLEETSFNYFLITSDPSSILPTIKTRCIKTEFKALKSEDITNILYQKLGFDINQARVLGWLGSGSSLDILTNAGTYLSVREQAFIFASMLFSKNPDIINLLDFIDKIGFKELPLFIDMLILIVTDALLLTNSIEDIINSDKREDLEKISKLIDQKIFLFVLSSLSDLKKDPHLNVNLNKPLKSVTIKTYNLIKYT